MTHWHCGIGATADAETAGMRKGRNWGSHRTCCGAEIVAAVAVAVEVEVSAAATGMRC